MAEASVVLVDSPFTSMPMRRSCMPDETPPDQNPADDPGSDGAVP